MTGIIFVFKNSRVVYAKAHGLDGHVDLLEIFCDGPPVPCRISWHYGGECVLLQDESDSKNPCFWLII